MPQFVVRRNANSEKEEVIPYLLDVQSDVLDSLATRVVVPLARLDAVGGKVAQRLSPVFTIEGQCVAMLTPELAGVPVRLLGPQVTSLATGRELIIAALDFLILGW